MKKIFAFTAFLLSTQALAQLPELPRDMAVADLNPARTDLYIGEHFDWTSPGSMLVQKITFADGSQIRCEVTDLTVDPTRTGVGPEALAVTRIDSADQGASARIVASPYAGSNTQIEFACERTVGTGEAATAFTIGDFKSLFPSLRRRTGFFLLPRPRS